MSVSRVLVLGANGMLGHKMLQVLMPLFPEVWGTLRGWPQEQPLLLDLFPRERLLNGVDVTAFDRLDSLLRDVRPDVVINCVGVIKHRVESDDAVTAITTNALLPHRLAMSLDSLGAKLIHFSTDCVFDGRQGMYVEDDVSNARDMYGRSKALGEVVAPNALTFRTSIIGRELHGGGSLLEWFLAQQGSVRGYRRAWWSGVTTKHLSEVVAGLLVEQPELNGLYHLSSGRISKYDLLLRLRSAYGSDIRIEPDDDFECDRSLDGGRFEALTGYRFPGWDVVLEQLVSDPTPYRERVVA